jgi:hypothetical protein
MKKHKWLTRTIAVILMTLLVCAGAGYATEYYQGRGNLEIVSEFNGFESMYTAIVISNGDIDLEETIDPEDGSITVAASAEGTYNSIREVMNWAGTSVSSEGTTLTVDVQDDYEVRASGLGTFINNAAANEKLERHEIIFLTNDYQ